MKEKGYSPEEIETFLAFLDRRVIEATQPVVQPLIQRIDQRVDRLELWFKYGFTVLAVMILVAPGALQDFGWHLFS
ncbi:MAG: hypothetical protein F4X92_00185 [Gammaproteobacteria bacterium]|nr:hypothetical protein [Gammaproteobacteria bacterium]